MYRVNTPADVANTGRAHIDAGEGVHLTVPTDGILVAEDLEDLKRRVSTIESTVDQIKLANSSIGEGPPSGAAPVGWWYEDVTTGDVYRMEA